MSVAGDVGATGVRRMEAAVGLESAEVPGRGCDREQPREDSRPCSFPADWATQTPASGDGGRARGELCICVTLPSCGLVPWVGAGPAESRVRDREG